MEELNGINIRRYELLQNFLCFQSSILSFWIFWNQGNLLLNKTFIKVINTNNVWLFVEHGINYLQQRITIFCQSYQRFSLYATKLRVNLKIIFILFNNYIILQPVIHTLLALYYQIRTKFKNYFILLNNNAIWNIRKNGVV